jgi:hypothetical protein
MTDPQHLVCLRCGFDLKTLKVVKTKTGVEEVEAPGAAREADVAASFSSPGRGGLYVPLTLAAVAGIVIIAGCLAGSRGLFLPHGEGQDPPYATFGGRMQGIARFVLTSGIWTGCAIAASFITAHLMGRKLGDLKLAAARMLGIIAVAQLARFIYLETRSIEWIIESALQVGVFIGLSMLLFKLAARDAATLAACTVAAFLVIIGSAELIAWLS